MGSPIDRTAKTALDSNLANGNISDAPKIKANNDVIYNYSDTLNSAIDAHAAAATLPHADGAVTETKIRDGAVTTAKIAPLAITRPIIAVGAVGTSQLDPALLTDFGDIAVQAEFDRRGINVMKYGAVGDGVTDDTASILATVNSLPSSGGVIFLPAGTFVCNGLILGAAALAAKSITFIGAGRQLTTLKRTTGGATPPRILQISGDGTNTIRFYNMTLDGNSLKRTGIYAEDLKRFMMENVEVKNCGVPGFSAGNQGSIDGVFLPDVEEAVIQKCAFTSNERDGLIGYPVTRLTVRDCDFVSNGRLASANTQNDTGTAGPQKTVYDNNYVYQCGAGGFDSETQTPLAACQINFINNRIIDCGNNDWGYGWGLVAGTQTFGLISGNYIKNYKVAGGVFSNGIQVSSKHPVTASGNTVEGCGGSGIFINDAGAEIVVSGNHCIGNKLAGIEGYNTTSCVITDNVVKSNQQYGIDLYVCAYALVISNKIINNSLEGSNLYSGIRSRLSVSLNISHNEISGTNQKYGFDLDSTTYIGTLSFADNRTDSFVTGFFNFLIGVSIAYIKSGRKLVYTSAAPAAGTYLQGDMSKNSAPTVGQPKGWVCTVAGTPGTWVSEGNL